MKDFKKLFRVDDHFELPDGEEITQLFPIEMWGSSEVYKQYGIKGYEPMTAKELSTDEMQDKAFSDSSNIIEEKFDGTRGIGVLMSVPVSGESNWNHIRVFSRRVSNVTGFYSENTDRLPHLRDSVFSDDMSDTVIDGEMFIDGLPFKEVSSTMNCLWDKAVDRQIEKGLVTFHAFDILKYHGIDLRRAPLFRRKKFLKLAIEEINNPNIVEVEYYRIENDGSLFTDLYTEISKRVKDKNLDQFLQYVKGKRGAYPNLFSELQKYDEGCNTLPPRVLYELIVATGGEGVIVKNLQGKYLHKRGWEYSKIKKFLTRDLIVIGFYEPTREYTGKDIKKWSFWERDSDQEKLLGDYHSKKGYTPVTKHYFNNQVGNLQLGVLITQEEYNKIPPKKRSELLTFGRDMYVMEVCDCAGFSDEMREYFTKNRDKMIGRVVEVKANELFKDTGKMRHPRFLRLRDDKELERCTWKDHIDS